MDSKKGTKEQKENFRKLQEGWKKGIYLSKNKNLKRPGVLKSRNETRMKLETITNKPKPRLKPKLKPKQTEQPRQLDKTARPAPPNSGIPNSGANGFSYVEQQWIEKRAKAILAREIRRRNKYE